MPKEPKNTPFLPVRIAVMTVSDTRTAANDTSGDALADLVTEHYDGVLEEYGIQVGVRAARKHLDWYLNSAGLVPGKDVRWSLLNSAEPQDVRRMIRELFAVPLREAA